MATKKTDEQLLSSFMNSAEHSLAWHLEQVECVPNAMQRAKEICARLRESASRGEAGKV